ncbi:peptidase inhibitor 16 precursor [Daubentonia madagascariensis]|uniref:Peptidase inhibitor 16 n=1 Tax=Daubentonia madagascariensis TaxID=31869 RepID=A0ABD2F305_DAUMA
MHSSCSFLVLLLLPLLLLVATTGPAGALKDDEKHVMVELHNLYRSQVSPPASDMLQMVVWAKTERIGCGSHFCEKLQGVEETNIQLLVCNYEPPGNVKGKRPYQEGTPCSQCPPDYRCENSLCEPFRSSEDASDLPSLVTEAPSSLATEASDSRKMGIPSSVATEIPSFLVTEVSGSLATKALPAVETEAPTSLERKDPYSMATEAPPSVKTEVPSVLATHSLLSLDEELVTFPKSTHVPIPKPADKVASKTRAPSMSPEKFLHPKMSLTGTGEPLPHAQEEAEAQAELPSSSEVLASVFPAQDKPGELQATLNHMGHTSSKSLPNFPNTSATANAMGGRTLALQSSLPGAEGPEKPGIKAGLNSGPNHVWGPLLGLLLLLPLVLAGIF